MDLDLVISIIEENGYLGLYLWLWFGIFVIPVPNEVILMTIGLASSIGSLHPILAFLVSYLGISTAFTSSYLLGRLIGRRILRFLEKRKRFAGSIESSMRLMEKYHAFSLSLSCFLPGVRNLVPFLYGMSRLPFKTFAVFAYSGAFIWVLIVFIIGYLFGDKMNAIIKYNGEMLMLGGVAAAGIMLAIVMRKRKMKHAALSSEGALYQERQQK